MSKDYLNSSWRSEFPAVKQHPTRIYFDNAATTQMPQTVIDCFVTLYTNGVTALNRTNGDLALTQAKQYQQAQHLLATYFGAGALELIITPSATAALNLVAANWEQLNAGANKSQPPGIALARHNHSSVLAPFMQLAIEKQVKLHWLDFDSAGRTNPRQLAAALTAEEIGFVAVPLVSNVLGVSEDLAHLGRLLKQARTKRKRPIYLLVDAAAAVLTQRLNFNRSGVDFLVVAAHKMYGPHLGAVCVRGDLLAQKLFVPKLLGGGNVIYQKGQYQLSPDPQQCWRAGVPDLVAVLAWAKACTWLQAQSEAKALYLQQLTQHLQQALQTISGINILASGKKSHLLSFVWPNYTSQDLSAYLSAQGVLARPGQHCAQKLYEHLKLPASLRFSLAHYNTFDEVDHVVALLRQVPKILIH
jgi:cysteine desulfurase/selenocysteine lyase